MFENPNTQPDPEKYDIYEFRMRGHLTQGWGDWFGNASITLEDDGTTCLTCHVIDQAALYGVLRQIRNLGMPLISVNRIKPGQ